MSTDTTASSISWEGINWDKNYWRITGTLQTLSDLHVGSGQMGNSKTDENETESSENLRLFVRGGETGDQPYIPGTVKGCPFNMAASTR